MGDPGRFLTPPPAPDTGAAEGKEMGRVDLWITGRCNQRCVFCYLYADEVVTSDDEAIGNVTEVLRAGRERGYTEVDFSGGEPTLNRAFPDMVRDARAMGYAKVKVMTNGLRFATAEFTRACADAGLTHVALSLHGSTPELYTKVHGTPGGFDKMRRAVDTLTSLAPGIELEVNTVANRLNLDTLPDLVRLVEQLGIPRVHVQLMIPNSTGIGDHFPGHGKAIEMFKQVIDMPRGIKVDFAFVEPCLMPGYEAHLCEFDFTVAFFTNDAEMLVGWQQSLLEAKHVAPQCNSCSYWATCRGFWTSPALEADLLDAKSLVR